MERFCKAKNYCVDLLRKTKIEYLVELLTIKSFGKHSN